MNLRDALKKSRRVEAWFDHYTAIVMEEDGAFTFSIRQHTQSPHFVHSGVTLEQVEREVAAIRAPYSLDWTPIE